MNKILLLPVTHDAIAINSDPLWGGFLGGGGEVFALKFSYVNENNL